MTKKKNKINKNIKLPELHFGSEICSDPARACELEWLETNGIGGFAASSILGMNTRRYHGLLVAALDPPSGRMVVLSKIDETVRAGDDTLELATNRYPGTLAPHGYEHIDSFNLDPFPRWVFRVKDYLLEKTVLLLRGCNAVAVRYRWLDAARRPLSLRPEGFEISMRPFVAFRDYHQLMRRNPYHEPVLSGDDAGGRVTMSPRFEVPGLSAIMQGLEYSDNPVWYYNFEYEVERRRGLDYQEDLVSPIVLSAIGDSAAHVLLFAMGNETQHLLESNTGQSLSEFFDRRARAEKEYRAGLIRVFDKPKGATKRMLISADAFIVDRKGGGKSILAGYPWFTDWGRDAMIALPGLTLATGRYGIARDVLATFASHIHDGLVPNRFPDSGGAPAYNTVDASLWYVMAVDSYTRATKDFQFIKDSLWDALENILRCYREGTHNNIHMSDDGLIWAGDPTTQLTWMDAKVGDWVCTPRHGKAVEINALWYNALRVMERLAGRVGADGAPYRKLARKVGREFSKQFWNREAGCLFDVINENGPDDAVRPNQIFALSLPRAMLPAGKRASVLDVVEKRLLTPRGLRSLAPEHSLYRGTYDGDVTARDGAYHNGTVWAWLMGPYISALLNVRGKNPATLKKAKTLIAGMEKHIVEEAGLNHVSEIFDGDVPHTPRGCFAQAWSVAELLRVKKELHII